MKNEEQNVIEWTRPMLARFKRAYEQAQGADFRFDGQEYVNRFAYYLIEYLENEFSKGGAR